VKPAIEHYAFGRMMIDGREYTSDLVVFGDGRVRDAWWRRQGHGLCMEDIAELVGSGVDHIIIGTGANGILVPDPGLPAALERRGIRLTAVPTAEAVERFNEARSDPSTGAGFHLTC
jgi:hypothetical protein